MKEGELLYEINKKRTERNVAGNKRLPIQPLHNAATDNEVAWACCYYLNGRS
jgi:hypothetical protein